jgi:hypothetical protein
MPTVKNVGEPCAREPHARFEVPAGGNQTSRASSRRAVGRLSPTLPRPALLRARANQDHQRPVELVKIDLLDHRSPQSEQLHTLSGRTSPPFLSSGS